MRAPSSRTSKIIGLTAGPLAVLAAGAMVWQGSTAAFTASTSSEANSWTTGTINLEDTDTGQATFALTGLAPGDKGARCIQVTATSSLKTQAGTIYASAKNIVGNTSATAEFSDHLMLTMEYVPASDSAIQADCTNFPATGATPVFSSTALSALPSATTAQPAGSVPAPPSTESQTTTVVVYKVSYEFNTTGLSQAQENLLRSQTTGATLEWELRAGRDYPDAG